MTNNKFININENYQHNWSKKKYKLIDLEELNQFS